MLAQVRLDEAQQAAADAAVALEADADAGAAEGVVVVVSAAALLPAAATAQDRRISTRMREVAITSRTSSQPRSHRKTTLSVVSAMVISQI